MRFLNVLLIGLVFSPQLLAQTPRREQSDDVIRVKTELVQTDVTVVDKRGRSVGGLRVDPICSFRERRFGERLRC